MSPIESLDRAACTELLTTVGLGRAAWAEQTGQVIVEPVNFAVEDDCVVFRTAEGEKLDAVRRGCTFSFEADDVEPALRVGWSVLVPSMTEIVTDPDELVP
jgi:nitroimidazol reductase NimA-like FMN-containing flavoprotein (pyridoxamine 5'-phosphate oxidase superfamily)